VSAPATGRAFTRSSALTAQCKLLKATRLFPTLEMLDAACHREQRMSVRLQLPNSSQVGDDGPERGAKQQ
jgi:hypothetical protein